jgi:ABC-type transport system substrate-binding protein
MEELVNIFQTLVQYNGSSTVSFIPYLAAALPTRENGGISSDYTTYTFQIRNDQYFSNGDPVTAYDVWFSMARCMAFTNGAPGTPDWVQAQFLIPGVQNGTANVYTNNTWAAATQTVTYDNATDAVTFHFNRPMPSTLVFQLLADSQGASIVDSRYAWSVGAGFNEANWSSYENQGNAGSYNTAMEWSPVGSGPFMVQSYTPGQSVELVPNPHYGGVPGIPKQNITVVIDWIKTPDTAMLMFQDGQADVVSGGYGGLPPSDVPAMEKLQSQGFVNIYDCPTFTLWFYTFNIQIDKDLEATQFGVGFNEPSNYFADVPTRLAWMNAYDYAGYLNNILGNAKYGMTFGTAYQGAIPTGMIYAPSPDQLGGIPAQNLNAARGNYSISAWAGQKITIPIVEVVGDPVDLAAAEEWAGILSQISNGNINAKVVQVTTGQLVGDSAQGADPMPVAIDDWWPDYPDPSDYINGFYQESGWEAAANNWLATNFASLPPSTSFDVVYVNGSTYPQDKVWSWMQDNITLGGTSVDPAVRARAYLIATKLAIAMGLYVYIYQAEQIWYFRSWLKGYEMQENPMIAGSRVLFCYWLTKG